MLPRLGQPPKTDELHRRFAEALREAGFEGDIQLDFASRLIQSTDNSIYQRLPQGVLYPAATEDLVHIARLGATEEFHSLHFVARGGGTGTNGQALGDGFIVDLSRHMNRILDIHVDQGWARVQAGVVKDQLNDAVREHGLFFAPDLSTSNRATIGGMISTDASGQGSCRYGKTRHHVLAIDMVLNDGERASFKALSDPELARLIGGGERIGQLHELLDSIHKEHEAAIERVFPDLSRSLSGYDLAHIRNKRGDEQGRLNLNNIICGSEGSLGFIAETVVNLERLPSHKAVVLIRYNDFVAALRDCQHLMKAEVTAIETLDNVVMELAKGDALWPQVAAYFPASEDSLAAINLMEVTAHCADELQQRLNAVAERLAHQNSNARLGHSILQEPEAMATLWNLRKRAVGLLGKLPGHARPIPFVEDCAVAPEQLPDFIAEFRALLDRESLRYGMFGHGDAGVIHVRPALDLREPSSMAVIRRVSDQVFALTQRYGGILWGEHGKGLRSEYVPATFGELYPQMQRIKAAFDPRNQFNPGKIASPVGKQSLLTIDAVDTRGQRDRLIPTQSWDDFPEAVYCNGNGVCFNWDPDQSMCPSWKGSQERKYSPKGRATLMKEWLGRLGQAGYSVRRGSAPSQSWISRVIRRVTPASRNDFSHEVYDAMESCLACRACATGCPVQVDVPTFRSVFLSHYFSRYRRPLRHHLIGGLERLLPFAAHFPRLYTATTESRAGRFIMERWLGLTAIPALQPIRPESKVELADPERLMTLTEEEKQHSVILVEDVFTRYLDGQVVEDICRLLRALGFRVWLASCRNGKPLHVLGYLHRFRQVARNTNQQLKRLSDSGIPLVGIEPSMSLIYRSDYRDYLDGDTAASVLLLQEWLASHRDRLAQYRQRFNAGQFRLLPHCTESATAGKSMKDWQTVFAALGSDLEIEQAGCCGMAGIFGHEQKFADLSRRIYQLSWAHKKVNSANTGASGFSCRSQVERFEGQRPPHPLQLLLAQLRD